MWSCPYTAPYLVHALLASSFLLKIVFQCTFLLYSPFQVLTFFQVLVNHFCSCLYLSDPRPCAVCSLWCQLWMVQWSPKHWGGLYHTFDAPSKRFECFFLNNGVEVWQSRGCRATWVTLLHLPIHHSRPSSVHQIKYGTQNVQGNVPSGIMGTGETARRRRRFLWVRH